jgi:ATP adenylyltransferase/5',5'''-P-1,P-4-tetraphosphate phosphorylase II
MSDNLYETMSDEQLQQNVVALQNERNKGMSTVEDAKAAVSKVNQKIELIVAEIGRRNYATMLESFVLTPEHLILLREYGSQVAEITESDLQIAEKLGWTVEDDGLSDAQEHNIARLLAELTYAQQYINKHADGLVNAEKVGK